MHSTVDLIADVTDLVDGLVRWVVELPVEILLARIDGARISAPHSDDDVGRAYNLVG